MGKWMNRKLKNILLLAGMSTILASCTPRYADYTLASDYYESNSFKIKMIEKVKGVRLNSRIINVDIQNELVADVKKPFESNIDFSASMVVYYEFESFQVDGEFIDESLKLVYYQQISPKFVDKLMESTIKVDGNKVNFKQRYKHMYSEDDQYYNSYQETSNISKDSIVYDYQINFLKVYTDIKMIYKNVVDNSYLVIPGIVIKPSDGYSQNYAYYYNQKETMTFYTINQPLDHERLEIDLGEDNDLVIKDVTKLVRKTTLQTAISEKNSLRIDEVDYYNAVLWSIEDSRKDGRLVGGNLTIETNKIQPFYEITIPFSDSQIKKLEISVNLYPTVVDFYYNPVVTSYHLNLLNIGSISKEYCSNLTIKSNQYIDFDGSIVQDINQVRIDYNNTREEVIFGICSSASPERNKRNSPDPFGFIFLLLVLLFIALPLLIIIIIVVTVVLVKTHNKKQRLENIDY